MEVDEHTLRSLRTKEAGGQMESETAKQTKQTNKQTTTTTTTSKYKN
jgi:hypothetical protein